MSEVCKERKVAKGKKEALRRGKPGTARKQEGRSLRIPYLPGRRGRGGTFFK